MYSISEFAKKIGVSAGTLRRWQADGRLMPIVLDSGHRRYTDAHYAEVKGLTKSTARNIVYVRESTRQQKNSLENQLSAVKRFCVAAGISIDEVIQDYGSGLNYKRKGLQQLIGLISTDQVSKLIVFYPDRLMRFGLEMFKQLCAIHNAEIIFVDESETCKSQQEEFADDLISIVHYFSMRLYGSRSYKEKKRELSEIIPNYEIPNRPQMVDEDDAPTMDDE